MTIDHADSVDDGLEGKHSKRARLKDALDRTKSKISKVKEERDARKQKQDQDQERPISQSNSNLSDDVDDFLSAGRPSFASQQSQRPSVGSDFRPTLDTSSPSPRPSTSDSQSQSHPSPRRVLPIPIPRIDVSASSRFPNAKGVHISASVPQPGSAAISSDSTRTGSLLKPEYKSRSQSASALASAERKARIRGLSVGFVDVPPVIIGEGGDEADAPPVEISRAKTRARSASPQGLRPYTNATVQPEARKQMPARGISDNSADAFVPKPFVRAQTAASLDGSASTSAPRGPHDDELVPKSFTPTQTVKPVLLGPLGDDFVPKPSTRAQTGASSGSLYSSSAEQGPHTDNIVRKPFSRTQTGFSVGEIPQPTRSPPSITEQPRGKGFMPLQLAGVQPGTMDLTKEFEMTLGLNSPVGPTNSRPLGGEAQIWAPKPKRAPPSYDLIEGGGKRHELNDRSNSPSSSHHQQNHKDQQSLQHLQYHVTDSPQERHRPSNVQRPSVPQTQPFAHQQVPTPPSKPSPPEAQPQLQRLPQSSRQLPQRTSPQTSIHLPPQRSPQSQARSEAQLPPRSMPQPPAQEFYPPPPQRTATQTARIPHKLDRISPKPSHQVYNDQEGTGLARCDISAPRMKADASEPLSLDTNHDGHRPVADRQRPHARGDSFGTPTSARKSPQGPTIRSVMPSNSYASSPSNYLSSLQSTPVTTQGEPMPNKLRFYESINKGNVPEGFI
ncbi:hypothetical protein LTR70_003219 [Exophiala xenobiotica]|uniref:Uncharacterized protein n=1 Tax=Lithohypha guttulata TaxID=1690604 RepID=A0ABR0KIQ2_9EURO|nr:hypothetical protein LTR24_002864 [Lithohypha guttulata]KAK5323731.1 hypothetical protein LTR70_003219 [Exophiala xenobiotica]